ncbi:MAG: hypothetical protein ACRELC_05245 [Gemmatimonadota bacterium]
MPIPRLSRLTAPDDLGREWDGRVVWVAAGLLLLLHFALAWWLRDAGVHVMRDDARYLILARSLRDLGFHDLYRVHPTLHTFYPPGYPALLLVWGSLFGERFDAFALLNALFSTAALGFAFAALRRVTGPGAALFCLLPLVVNPSLIERAGTVRSEPAYTCLSMAALWLVTLDPTSRRAALGAGAAAIAATLTRINGLTLIAGIGLHWLLGRRYRRVVWFGLAGAVLVGGWMAWGVAHQTGLPEDTYVSEFVSHVDPMGRPRESLLLRIPMKIWRVGALGLPLSVPIPTIEGTPVDNLIGTGGLVVALAAGLVVLFRRWRATVFYLGLYGLTVIVWPFLTPRFLEPVLPLLVPAALIGGAALAGVFRPSWRSPALVGLALFLAASAVVQTVGFARVRAGCGPFDLGDPPACLTENQRGFLRALDLVKRVTPENAVLLSTMPEPLYFHTGRRAIPIGEEVTDPEGDFLAFLRREGVRYVLVSPNGPSVARRLAPRCARLVLLGAFPGGNVVVRLAEPDEAVEARAACDALGDIVQTFERGR